MRKTTTLATVVVSAMLSLVGLAGSVLADKDDPVDPKMHKEDYQHQFVNLGVIGDTHIECANLEWWVGAPDGSRDGILVPATPVNLPGITGNFCFGGAIGEYDPSDSRERWDVWIHDYVWNGCDAHTVPGQDGLCPVQPQMGWGVEGTVEAAMETMTSQPWTVELKAAGYALTVTTYDLPFLGKAPGSDADNCVPISPNIDPESGPRACLQEKRGPMVIGLNNPLGFCGQGSIDAASGMADPFDISNGPSSAQAVNVQVQKRVFVDGPLFYQWDCPFIDVLPREWYEFLGELVNPLICPLPDSDYGYCIFPPSLTGSPCFMDKLENNVPAANQINLPVLGLVGEIGWTHEETTTCKQQTWDVDWWAHREADLYTVFKGMPPLACASAVYVASGFSHSAANCGRPDCRVRPPAIPPTFVAQFGYSATDCVAPECELVGPGFSSYSHAFEQNVVCSREDGCNGQDASTGATVSPAFSLAGDQVTAHVNCNPGVVAASSATVTTNLMGASDTAGPEQMPFGDYECRMDFRVVAGLVPFFGVAACYINP